MGLGAGTHDFRQPFGLACALKLSPLELSRLYSYTSDRQIQDHKAYLSFSAKGAHNELRMRMSVQMNFQKWKLMLRISKGKSRTKSNVKCKTPLIKLCEQNESTYKYPVSATERHLKLTLYDHKFVWLQYFFLWKRQCSFNNVTGNQTPRRDCLKAESYIYDILHVSVQD